MASIRSSYDGREGRLATEWRPLFSGEEVLSIRETARRVTEAALRHTEDESGQSKARAAFLSNGLSGALVAHFEIPPTYRRADWAERGDRLWGIVTAALAEFPYAPSLFSGFVGPAWVAANYNRLEDEEFADIDQALLEVLRTNQQADFDLMRGLAGIGVYALERRASDVAHDILLLVIERLLGTAVRDSSGIRWRTEVRTLPEDQRASFPGGAFNCGMAHGQPGVLSFMARVLEEVPGLDRLREPIGDACRWLIAQRHPEGSPSWFPGRVKASGERVGFTRITWCHGDLGVGLAVLRAGTALRSDAFTETGIELLRSAAARLLNGQGQTLDLGLCHGLAGVAHLLNRGYQATHDSRLNEAAVAAYRLLRDRLAASPDVRDLRFEVSSKGSTSRSYTPAFHTGAIGAGVALWAAAADEEPTWDRVLLTDVKSASARQSTESG